MHACMHAYIHTYITYITYIHAYIHTYITYIHAYMHVFLIYIHIICLYCYMYVHRYRTLATKNHSIPIDLTTKQPQLTCLSSWSCSASLGFGFDPQSMAIWVCKQVTMGNRKNWLIAIFPLKWQFLDQKNMSM